MSADNFHDAFNSDVGFFVNYCKMKGPFSTEDVDLTVREYIRFLLTKSGRFSFHLRLADSIKLAWLKTFYFGLINHFYNSDLSSQAFFGRELYFPHPFSLVIGTGVILSGRIIIFNDVTLGKMRPGTVDGMPQVKLNVILCVGCRVIGETTINEDSVVAANAVVASDVGPQATIFANGKITDRVYWQNLQIIEKV